MTHAHCQSALCPSELVSTVILFLPTTLALRLRFRLHVHEFGFYLCLSKSRNNEIKLVILVTQLQVLEILEFVLYQIWNCFVNGDETFSL